MSNKVSRSIGKRFVEAIFGAPKDETEIKKTKTAVLGTVEQNYGMYQIPSFIVKKLLYGEILYL